MGKQIQQTFLKGAFILGFAEIIVKIIGAFYRIPLTRIIGDEGMGYYSAGFIVYTWLFTLSTTGVPVAISKLVSEKLAFKEKAEAHRIFQISFILLFIVGILMSMGLYMGADAFAEWIHNPSVKYIMVALAPTLFFVALSAGFRGYFQGYQNMTPTAISKVVEQAGKAIFGIWLAVFLLPKGVVFGAAGATFGTTVGALLGMVVLWSVYKVWNQKNQAERKRIKSQIKDSTLSILWRLVKISIPISIGASVYTAANLVDLSLIQSRLTLAGFSPQEANVLFGQYAGKSNTLVNFPTVVTMSLSAALVPSIAGTLAKGKYKEMEKRIHQAFRMTLLIALPSAVGMAILAQPILMLLFDTQLKGAKILEIGALSVVFLALVQAMTGILQGVGRVMVPAAALLIGAVGKILVNYYLIAIPSINIIGAPIGNIVCYLTAALINYYFIKRYACIHISLKKLFLKPLLATGAMAICVKSSYQWVFVCLAKQYSRVDILYLVDHMKEISSGNQIFQMLKQANLYGVLTSVFIGIFTYGFFLLFTQAITYEDFCFSRRLQVVGDLLWKWKWIQKNT